MRSGGMPASTSFSSSSMRSPAASELASELVPNTARPTLFATSHLHWRTKRSVSGLRSALNGVTTGDSTPVMRWVMLNSPVCVVLAYTRGRQFSLNSAACAWRQILGFSQKIEIAAVLGLQHAAHVQLGVSALGRDRAR